jgi:quinol monooxygenase YgiN
MNRHIASIYSSFLLKQIGILNISFKKFKESNMLTIVAEIRAYPNGLHKDKIIQAFKKITPTVLQEQGCHGYQLLVDAGVDVSYQSKDSDLIVMLEKWESIEHLNAHLQTEHMQAYQLEVKEHVADVKIRILEQGF